MKCGFDKKKYVLGCSLQTTSDYIKFWGIAKDGKLPRDFFLPTSQQFFIFG